MDLEKRYEKLIGYVEVLLNGKISSLFVLGKAGIGKSYHVMKTLKENDISYIKIAGHITPIKLYNTLFEAENNDTEVIVFDDTYSIMKSEESVSILMACLWAIDGLRTVTWLSNSKYLTSPEAFQFTKKVILIQNSIPKGSSLYALLDRAYTYTLSFNYEDLIDIMYEIAKHPSPTLSPEKRKKLVEFISKHSGPGTKISLRNQNRLEDLFTYHKNWRLLGLEELKVNQYVIDLLKKHKTVKEAEEEFVKNIGCRRTFYNLKKSAKV